MTERVNVAQESVHSLSEHFIPGSCRHRDDNSSLSTTLCRYLSCANIQAISVIKAAGGPKH